MTATGDIAIAADLGGTNLRMAAVSDQGSILDHLKTATPHHVSPEHLVEIVVRLSQDLLETVGPKNGFCGIGFAAPTAASDGAKGTFSELPNLPSLNGMDLGGALEQRLGLPFILENDATAAAIGENWLGASVDVATSIMITLGTGVGGGIIIDGRPFRGLDGTGGELGHICVEPDGHSCGCGSHGCIEQYASATGVVRMANESGLNFSTSLEIFEAAMNGLEAARQVYIRMGRYLGITLAGLANALNPQMIVIGGGASEAWDAFIDPLKAELKYRAFDAPAARVRIVPAKLGDNAGLLGAAHSVFRSVRG